MHCCVRTLNEDPLQVAVALLADAPLSPRVARAVAVGFKEVSQPMIPVVNGDVQAIDELLNLPVGQPGVIQELAEDTPLSGVSSRQNTSSSRA